MADERTDVAIAGGGLSGGLIALALHRADPARSIRLIEAGDTLGGNHRWSWFASDLGQRETALLGCFPATGWPDYEVRFPAYTRPLASPYRSLASTDFAQTIASQLPPGAILTSTAIASLGSDHVTLNNGTRITARSVIDCRGVTELPELTGGWQIFMGKRIRTAQPHGLGRPVIMDAAVEQLGGYRFVYVLPLSERDIFVEDTYYADRPELDRPALSSRIDAYCAAQGWRGETLDSETGILPVITGGDFSAWQKRMVSPGVARAGARGGFVHPLTSYTLPQAARIALLVADNIALPGPDLAQLLVDEAKAHWRKTRFYRMLGSMLFAAAQPEERYRIFERFYRLSPALIERFYAARSTWTDRARILTGRPPVPVGRALRAITTKGNPLTKGSSR